MPPRRNSWPTPLCVAIERFSRAEDQLSFTFKLGDLRFNVCYWYEGVNLPGLEAQFGRDYIEKIYFHIAAFEANKFASLQPETFDLGPFRHLYTDQFERLWRTLFRKIWAQWRFENELPNYDGPVFSNLTTGGSPAAPVTIQPGPVEILSFCGGGKDSLVAMKLLERAGIPYSSYAYSHSIYGRAELQHELIGGLLDHCVPAQRHRHWVYDDFLGSPVIELHREFGVQTMLAAETPSSIFGAIPVVLQHGYRYVALAHERSADTGNLIWNQTGEEVNHQWGKSREAELLLNTYIREELISNVSYFSVLKPIYDVLIFQLLRRDLAAVPATHSCNVSKPWCGRCPKCAYVWLNYMAYLPVDLVDSIFGRNLFDVRENQLAFRRMLGLEDHTPFECIGEVAEARLAFEMCRMKGLSGHAMDMFKSEVPPVDVLGTLAKYLAVDASISTIPAHFAPPIFSQMEEAADAALQLPSFGAVTGANSA